MVVVVVVVAMNELYHRAQVSIVGMLRLNSVITNALSRFLFVKAVILYNREDDSRTKVIIWDLELYFFIITEQSF